MKRIYFLNTLERCHPERSAAESKDLLFTLLFTIPAFATGS